MTRDYQQVIIRLRWKERWLVPPELRGRLLETARERESNLTDVIVEILSEKYGVEYDLTDRRSNPAEDAASITARMPVSLHRAIAQAAGKAYPQRSIPDEIRAALCAHYDLAAVA